MADVSASLRDIDSIGLGSSGALKSLVTKHELLLSLLDNEQMRLEVWLYPLGHEKRHFFSSINSNKLSQEVSIFVAVSVSVLKSVGQSSKVIRMRVVGGFQHSHPFPNSIPISKACR